MKTNNTAGNGGVVLRHDTNICQFDFAAQLRLENALFGSLQKITAQQLGLDPVLMTAANSAGGVMGKMVDAQSICVATAATNQVGNEGFIFRFVVWHSLALGGDCGRDRNDLCLCAMGKGPGAAWSKAAFAITINLTIRIL